MVIKSLLDGLRKDIVVKNEMQLLRLEHLKRIEDRAIEENSDESVEQIREYVYKQKNEIREYPVLGLKSQWINGEFIITKL